MCRFVIRCCALSTESFYRERYLQKSKEQEQLRKKLQSRAEEEIEELSNQKRTLERRVKKLAFFKFVVNVGRLPLARSGLPGEPVRMERVSSAVFRDLCGQTDPSLEE